ncbi:MAG: Smr/MutS family protein [Balneolaceae bacterium]
MSDSEKNSDKDEPVRIPIDGVLDLHNFKPSDLGTLIDEYIHACMKEGICNIRIIHGKGTGALRRSVHHLLRRNRHVVRFEKAGDRSGWGATVAILEKKPSK